MQTLEPFSLKSGLGDYYKIGTGYPLVLLHGFAETYATWQNIIPTLSSKYSLIIPQIPGCGTQQEATSTFSMEFIATFVNEILEQEAIEKTILFGHSMGGYAAMAFAENFPQKLLGLSLVHSSAQADSEEKKQVRQNAVDFIRANGKEAFLKTLMPKLYGSLKDYQNEKQQHLAMAMQYTDQQIIACYEAMMHRPDRTGILAELSIPVQFIAGTDDQSIDINSVKHQMTLTKNGYLNEFEGIGHSSMYENPNLLLAAIIGFADDILANFKS